MRLSKFRVLSLLVGLACWFELGWPIHCQADVRLPGFFGDHMVLQQGMAIPVWGWADPGETVKVALGQANASSTADDQGTWRVELPAMKADNQPRQLTVTGKNELQLVDVLIGEVWLCSGQSNMEWSVRQSANANQEIASANYPMIRHMKAPRKPSPTSMDDLQSQWQICSPETVAGFTAAGYFMAQQLHKELGVPIGLVNSSWGGTRVEPWTPPVGFQNVKALKEIAQAVDTRTPGTKSNQELIDEHIAATQAWLDQSREARKKGSPIQPNPTFPSDLVPFASHQDPTMLYNGMIHALVGFPIRGAIWYQGESNHSDGMLYFEKKKALINGWREVWGQGEFPFYFVQIAPFQYGNEDPTILAEFWEAQEAVLSIPKTGMVVINDIATIKNIHPPNKQEVGRRLALLALKNEYGKKTIVATGPVFESLEALDGKLKVNFSNTGGGLKTRDGLSPDRFEIIDAESGGFQVAEAVIEGDAIILSAGQVKHPMAMRFAWHKLAEPNLMGGTGLPCGAFRAGEVPEFVDTVPGIKDFRLVYDLDLANLGPEIKYSIDARKAAGKFDRIAYLLELESQAYGDQNLFVSMEAFTEDVNRIGLPTASSKAHFQKVVGPLDVYSNDSAISTGQTIKTGSIEYWPNNYAVSNSANVEGASATIYDFGDEPVSPTEGYGSMQIHDIAAKRTLFSINNWRSGQQADIGIGNSSGRTRDWTFTKNAGSYTKKRLRVYVRETN